MLPRAALPRVLLACCLVWAQHAALAHALEHQDDGGGPHPPAHHETGVACDLCLAYVPLGAGVVPEAVAALRVKAGAPPTLAAAVPVSFGDARRHAYLSRAPPAAMR